jgi:hypothetical protein
MQFYKEKYILGAIAGDTIACIDSSNEMEYHVLGFRG